MGLHSRMVKAMRARTALIVTGCIRVPDSARREPGGTNPPPDRIGRRHMKRVVLLGIVMAVALCVAATARAQTATGQITGSVQDPSGGVMRKVKVTVTNQET